MNPTEKSQKLYSDVAEKYLDRKNRTENPDGNFDKAGRKMSYCFVVDDIPNNSGDEITGEGYNRFRAALQRRFDEMELEDEIIVVGGNYPHEAKFLPYYSRLNDVFEELLARHGGELLF